MPQRLQCGKAKKLTVFAFKKATAQITFGIRPTLYVPFTEVRGVAAVRPDTRKETGGGPSQPCILLSCHWLVWWKGGMANTKTKRSTYPTTLRTEVRRAGSWALVP